MLADDILARLLFLLSGSLVMLAGILWWKAGQLDERERQSRQPSSRRSSGSR